MKDGLGDGGRWYGSWMLCCCHIDGRVGRAALPRVEQVFAWHAAVIRASGPRSRFDTQAREGCDGLLDICRVKGTGD